MCHQRNFLVHSFESNPSDIVNPNSCTGISNVLLSSRRPKMPATTERFFCPGRNPKFGSKENTGQWIRNLFEIPFQCTMKADFSVLQ